MDSPLRANIRQPLPGLRDRSGTILTLGIIQIVLGGLCGLFALMGAYMAVSFVARIDGGRHPMAALAPALVYVLPTLNLLVTGIGSVTFRRWARLATIISAGFWIALTAIGTIGIVVALSTEKSHVGSHVGLGEGTILGILLIPMLLILLGLPITLIALYARKDVRATFERRHAARIPAV